VTSLAPGWRGAPTVLDAGARDKPGRAVTVATVQGSRFAAGGELLWRLKDGNFRSGYHYVLEDSAGDECANVAYTRLGYPKRISVATGEYRCRRGIGPKRGRIDVLDSTSGDFVAATNLGRHATITARDHPTLRVVVTGGRTSSATMTVVDAHDRPTITLRWIQAGRPARRTIPQGEAIMGDTDLGDDLVIVVACLAFHAFAAASS
jgi:hypothetical protein